VNYLINQLICKASHQQSSNPCISFKLIRPALFVVKFGENNVLDKLRTSQSDIFIKTFNHVVSTYFSSLFINSSKHCCTSFTSTYSRALICAMTVMWPHILVLASWHQRASRTATTSLPSGSGAVKKWWGHAN